MIKTKLAQKGLNKFTSLKTSNAMRAYRKKYEEAGYKYSDLNKTHFYEFVARSRLRRKNK